MLLVGTHCTPKVGLRVEAFGRGHDLDSVFDFDFKGHLPQGIQGSIEAISADGMNCTVQWDNGEVNICKCGSGSNELVVHSSAALSIHPFPIKNANTFSASQMNNSTSKAFLASQPRFTPTSSATLGLRVYQGQKVDFVVPGGPAHLSQMFERNDEIIAVDGMEVTSENLQDAILGDDIEGSAVTLTVRKFHTGNIIDVQLTRVSKKSLQSMGDLLEILDQLKKRHGDSGHTNLSALADTAFSLISNVMLERNIGDSAALASARRVIEQHENEIARLEYELTTLQQTLTRNEAFERGRERANVRPDNGFDNRDEHLRMLQQALHESQNSNQQNSAYLNAARQQVKKLEEKIISLEAERDRFTQQTVQELKLKYSQDLSSSEQTIQQLASQMSVLEKREKKQVLELEEAREQAATMHAKLQRLENESHLRSKNQIESMQEQLVAKESVERLLREELHAAQTAISELKEIASGAKTAALEQQITDLKQSILTLQSEKSKLQMELSDANKKGQELEVRISDSESAIKLTAENKDELQSYKTTLDEQVQALQSLKEREGVLSEALQAAQLHIQNLEMDREQRMETAGQHTTTVRELKAELEAREDTVRLLRMDAQKMQEELENKEVVIKDLSEQADMLRQQIAKGDSAGSAKVLEKLRVELQQSQKQVSRLEEEQQLSRAAIEEARKVLIECGRLRTELKEKNDLLKEAQSLVIDQESTIRILQTNIQEHEAQSNVKLKEYEDEVNKLKIMIEDLKAQWQKIHEKQLKQHAEEIEKLKSGKGYVERSSAIITPDANTPDKQRAPRLLSVPLSRSKMATASNVVTLGIKISDNHPHYVQDISDLMDEHGKIINNEINIGDELIQVDNTETKVLSGEDFKRLLDGEAGTLVSLHFRDLVTNSIYKIKAQRHYPVQSPAFPSRNFDS